MASRDLGRGETGVDSDMQLVAYAVGASTLSRHATLAAQRDAAGPHGAESLRAAGAFAVVRAAKWTVSSLPELLG